MTKSWHLSCQARIRGQVVRGLWCQSLGDGEGYPPPKFNSEFTPEKWWLEDYFPIGKVTFQERTVKLLGGYLFVGFKYFFCSSLLGEMIQFD